MSNQLIAQEEFTSVQQAQAGITRLFKEAAKKKRFFRVMRNQKPLGVLIPDELWHSLIEDLEALSSPSYLKSITQSRKDKTRISAAKAKKKLKIK